MAYALLVYRLSFRRVQHGSLKDIGQGTARPCHCAVYGRQMSPRCSEQAETVLDRSRHRLLMGKDVAAPPFELRSREDPADTPEPASVPRSHLVGVERGFLTSKHARIRPPAEQLACHLVAIFPGARLRSQVDLDDVVRLRLEFAQALLADNVVRRRGQSTEGTGDRGIVDQRSEREDARHTTLYNSDARTQDAYDLYARGRALLRDGHPHQAAMLLGRAKLLEPEKASIREALGRALYMTARYRPARREFAKTVALDPSDDYAHFALGLACERTGQHQRARGHLRLAVALRPGVSAYEAALERSTV